jgi:hypothetical protein
MKAILALPFAAALAPAAENFVVFQTPGESPPAQLTSYLNAIRQKQLVRRAAEIAAIKTRAQAERRQQVARERIPGLIGGLPGYHGPLNTRVVGFLLVRTAPRPRQSTISRSRATACELARVGADLIN